MLARSNAPGQYHAFRSPPGGTGRLLAAAATRAEATACLEREVVARAVTAGGKLGDGGTAGGGYDVALCTRVSGLHVTSSVCTLCRAAARRRLRLRPALAASHDGVDACASGSASANTCAVSSMWASQTPRRSRPRLRTLGGKSEGGGNAARLSAWWPRHARPRRPRPTSGASRPRHTAGSGGAGGARARRLVALVRARTCPAAGPTCRRTCPL